MEYNVANAENGDVPRFFISGRFSDFEIRLPKFTFRVHKVVICSKSKYFETLCGEDFLEGSRGFVELEDDENPAMIARMLQVMYCGEYGTHFYEVLLPIVMENSLSNKKASGVTKTDVEPPSFKVHALLYAMGDRYQFPTLVDLARTKFIASMNEPGFTLDDLVTAIDVVYSTTIDTDDRLRKHVVYRAQCYMQELKNLDNFKEVYEKYVGFSWDFGLNYRHCKTVWCAACGANSKLPSACLCGFHGLCQNLKLCNELDWSGLKCTSCKRVGQLLREEPRDDEGVQFTGMGKSKSLPNSPNGATSPRKKRKSM